MIKKHTHNIHPTSDSFWATIPTPYLSCGRSDSLNILRLICLKSLHSTWFHVALPQPVALICVT